MRNKIVQISLFDTYNSVASSIENSNPELLTLLDEHINFNSFIPIYSRQCFYKNVGRRHKYHLESFVRACFILQLSIFILQNKYNFIYFKINKNIKNTIY